MVKFVLCGKILGARDVVLSDSADPGIADIGRFSALEGVAAKAGAQAAKDLPCPF